MTERIYILSNAKNNKFRNNINHHDLFDWNSEGTNKEHTRSYPLSLCISMLSCFESETILDPFMGSGTTLRAAKDLNRKAIGIELEEKYCEIAAKRLSQEVFDFGV